MLIALPTDLVVIALTFAYNPYKPESWGVAAGGLLVDVIAFYLTFYVREYWLDFDPYMTMFGASIFDV